MVAERIIGKKFPLEEKRIILTQTESQIQKIEKILSLEKAVPVPVPCIEPIVVMEEKELRKSLSNLDQYDWVIFTSQNAFMLFHDELKKMGKIRLLTKLKVATVGHETKDVIEQYGFEIAFTPEIPKTSKEFFEQWTATMDLKGKKIMFPRSKRSISKVPQNLIDLGATVVPIEFYDVRPHKNIPSYYEALVSIETDWIMFSSPTAVNSFFSMRSNDEEIRHWIFSSGVKIVTIGPSTSEALDEKRVPVSCESPKPSSRWMIETMKAFEKLENWDTAEEE